MTDLNTLIKQMESVSPHCQCSIHLERGTQELSLWWIDGSASYLFKCLNTRATLKNPAFARALVTAKEKMKRRTVPTALD